MAVPKKKVSKARKHTRFSANSVVSAPSLVECPHCHTLKESHKVCPECGYYKGREVVAKKDDEKSKK